MKNTTSAPPVPSGTLAPYTGPWTVREAGHLMRRATFGPSKTMIERCINLGLDAAIDELLDNVAPPEPPVKWFLDAPHPNPLIRPYIPYVDDPESTYGETWVNTRIIPQTGDPTRDSQINLSRLLSMYSWLHHHMNKEIFSIREKMSVFWHNHFVVGEFAVPKLMYQYYSTIYEHVVGDFRQLTKDMTIDPAMLLYLNGAESRGTAPNENYARELLELFTVGKGDIAGPGDYTTFTEDDVKEIARALTGWSLPFDILTQNPVDVDVVYYFFFHDLGTKRLSSRLGNKVINNAGEDEYKNVIDAIFESPNVALFLSRKLYRYFIHYNITPEIESTIIEPMAQILRDNDYQVKPAIKALLSSEHFYGEEAIGCMIKNPSDFYISMMKGLGVQFDGKTSFILALDQLIEGPILDYYNALILWQMSDVSGMGIFNHPSVAGWKAYYQSPGYYRSWLSTVTLPLRANHSTSLINGLETQVGDERYTFQKSVPVLDIVAAIPDAQDPNALIFNLTDLFFPYGVTEGQKDYLKEVLIPGLPDFEWTVEYSDYVSDPADPAKREAVDNRLRALFTAMLQMPESQLM